MKSKHENVAAALSALPAKVVYLYPQDWGEMPTISYYEISNLPEGRADDGEYSTELEYVVDIWSKSPPEMAELGTQVNDAMATIGFERVFTLEMYENDTKTYHKTMRFRGVF